MFETLRRAGVKVALPTGYAKPVANSIMSGLGWTVGETVDALAGPTSDQPHGPGRGRCHR